VGLAAVGLGRHRRKAEVALGVATSLLGLVFGLLGLVLVLVWVATNHKAAHVNENILQCAPLALGLLGFGVGVARGRESARRKAFFCAAGLTALSLLGVALKVLPAFRQDNWEYVVLFLPLWAGLAAALGWPSLRAPKRRSVEK
jgi:hypothetical protein